MDPSYNNSFGGVGTFSQPAAGQPVVLSSAKKKHTGAIVFVILLLCLVVAGVVAFLLIPKNGTSADMIQRYKNYIITGNENAQDTEERYDSGDIWFKNVYYDGEDSEWTTLYDKANSILDVIGANEKMVEKVTAQKDILKMLNADREIGDGKMDSFIKAYLNGRENGMYDAIMNKIDNLRESDDDYVIEYSQKMNGLSEMTIKYAEYFRNLGCNFSIIESLDQCYGQFLQNIEGFNPEAENYEEIALWQEFTSKEKSIKVLVEYSVDHYINDVYNLAIVSSDDNAEGNDEQK